jgi:predicted metal-dependent HD superfamily phosphohydrolase
MLVKPMMGFDFQHAWQRAWQGVGGCGAGDVLYETLYAAYSEPHRHYHTLQHLAECLIGLGAVYNSCPSPDEVEMALWFHDAIYDVKRADNEARSAAWATRALTTGGVSEAVVKRVHGLIMATQHSAQPDTLVAQYLVDIDLAILATPPARFAEYDQQIRAEYSFVPDWLYQRKRRAVLQSFLDREAIYSTPHFKALFEERARANLNHASANG